MVAATDARGGSVLVLDPHAGDVLAAASWPLVSDRRRPQRDRVRSEIRPISGSLTASTSRPISGINPAYSGRIPATWGRKYEP